MQGNASFCFYRLVFIKVKSKRYAAFLSAFFSFLTLPSCLAIFVFLAFISFLIALAFLVAFAIGLFLYGLEWFESTLND